MISFKEYVDNSIPESEVDQMVEELTWEDIADLYEEEWLEENFSSASRKRRGQRLKSRKSRIGQSRKLKTHRAASLEVLKKRAKLAGRRMAMKRILHSRKKSQLSSAEKDRVEKQVKTMMATQTTLTTKFLPKVRELERKRLNPHK
jgi:hypothetical protein